VAACVMLYGVQIRAARALLRWSIEDLAEQAGVGSRTIRRAENVDGIPRMRTDTMDSIQLTLERAGVAFVEANSIGGPGVRLKRGR
jgi:transcriptional regulator with XRE-family HTH domain